MRKLIILLIFICLLATSVSATEFIAPKAPAEAEKYMPEDTGSFGEDLWFVIKKAIGNSQPYIKNAAGICASLLSISLLISLLNGLSGSSKFVLDLTATLAVALLLTQPVSVLTKLGVDTINSLSQYGKLLLPVMSAAMAAQGAVTASAALYTGTAIFLSVLTSAIHAILIPLIYVFIVISIANCAAGNELLKHLQKFIKWMLTWCLKITIYLFTGYLGITGVVNGTADAAAIKATKLAISGFIPVVGKVVSEASETVLVSAAIMKNAAGIYGMIAVLAICIGPFLQIGIQYLILKITASLCSVFGSRNFVELINDFSTAMGYLLATTGTICILLLVSTVCFMKGVS